MNMNPKFIRLTEITFSDDPEKITTAEIIINLNLVTHIVPDNENCLIGLAPNIDMILVRESFETVAGRISEELWVY